MATYKLDGARFETLEELTHILTIQSSPIPVPLTLNGSPVGNTPITINVQEGPHIISVPSEVTT